MQVVLRADVQQPVEHLGLQEQQPVRDQPEEPDVVQGVSSAQVFDGGHVQERLALRPPLQLVQNPLPAAGAERQQQQQQLSGGGGGAAGRRALPKRDDSPLVPGERGRRPQAAEAGLRGGRPQHAGLDAGRRLLLQVGVATEQRKRVVVAAGQRKGVGVAAVPQQHHLLAVPQAGGGGRFGCVWPPAAALLPCSDQGGQRREPAAGRAHRPFRQNAALRTQAGAPRPQQIIKRASDKHLFAHASDIRIDGALKLL